MDILKNMFLPSKKMIKEQIEWLIEHKYMKRDEDNINMFIYMAWLDYFNSSIFREKYTQQKSNDSKLFKKTWKKKLLANTLVDTGNLGLHRYELSFEIQGNFWSSKKIRTMANFKAHFVSSFEFHDPVMGYLIPMTGRGIVVISIPKNTWSIL